MYFGRRRDNHPQHCNSILRVCQRYFSRRRDNHAQYCNSTLRVCQTYFGRRRDDHPQHCNSTLRVCQTYYGRRRDNHAQYCNSTLRVCQTYFSRRRDDHPQHCNSTLRVRRISADVMTITHNTAIVHCVSVKRISADVVTITQNTAIVHRMSVKRTSADVRCVTWVLLCHISSVLIPQISTHSTHIITACLHVSQRVWAFTVEKARCPSSSSSHTQLLQPHVLNTYSIPANTIDTTPLSLTRSSSPTVQPPGGRYEVLSMQLTKTTSFLEIRIYVKNMHSGKQ